MRPPNARGQGRWRVASTPLALTVGVLTVLLAGCGDSEVTAAAFPEPAVTLTISVPDQPGRYSYDVTEEFARRVTEKTDGSLTVEVRDLDVQQPRWNQEHIRRAQDGDIDLLVVQSQAFDTIEVDTFTALYVPFLITDEKQLDAVATSDVADDMLAGLQGTGLTGLGLVPGGLRHLFNETQAPTRPDDIVGDGVRVAYSETVWAVFEALGARPDDPNGNDLGQAFREGRIAHLDSTFEVSDGFLTSPKTAGDLPTYPLALAIVANHDVFAELTGDQRAVLTTTAREVAQWAADTRPSGAQQARALCMRSPGAEVVLAGDEALQEWRTATAGLAAELRSDPDIDALATRIEAIGADLAAGAEPVVPCSGSDIRSQDKVEAPPAANVPAEFPEGVYRKEVSAAELVEAGVTRADAFDHAGVWTIDLREGVFNDPGCPESTYEIVDDRLVVTLGTEGEGCGSAAGAVLFSGGWQLDGASLTFTDVRSGHGSDLLISALFGGEPWTRIG